MRGSRWTLLLALCPLLAGRLEASSLRVLESAAFGGPQLCLEITLDDPVFVPPADAWVGLGQDKGLNDETALAVSLRLDPRRLAAPIGAKLIFLRLAQDPVGDQVRAAAYVSRTSLGWLLGIDAWDDGAERFLPAGLIEIPLPRRSSTRVPRLEIRWSSGPAGGGRLQVLRRISLSRAVLLLEKAGLDNASQKVNAVSLGVLAAEHPGGAAGLLAFDDFELVRGPFEDP